METEIKYYLIDIVDSKRNSLGEYYNYSPITLRTHEVLEDKYFLVYDIKKKIKQ